MHLLHRLRSLFRPLPPKPGPITYDQHAPDADGVTLDVRQDGRVIGRLHCIAVGGGRLCWYGSNPHGATGNAKSRADAANDVIIWNAGGAPAYQWQGLPTKYKSGAMPGVPFPG